MPHPHPSAASAKSSPMDHGGFQGTRYPKSSVRDDHDLVLNPVFWGSYILRKHFWDISESCRIQRSILLLLTIIYSIIYTIILIVWTASHGKQSWRCYFCSTRPCIYNLLYNYIYIYGILGLMKGKILRKIPYFIIFHGKIHGFRCRFSETHHVLWWDDEWGSRHTEPAGDMENPLSTLEAWTGAGTWWPRPGGHLQQPPWLVTFPWWLPTMWGPPVISWFINPMKTIVISTINHSYWSYKPT